MDIEKYSPKGAIKFIYADDEIQYVAWEYSEDMLDMYEVRICGDMMSGKEFYECVDDGCIIDYDGCLGNVFVNGLKSNLGLFHKGMSQGDFAVDGKTWLEICEEFNVEVEWCNK